MSATKTTKEGRVNVPLGPRKEELSSAASEAGTTETNLARSILFKGLDMVKSGEWKFHPATLVELGKDIESFCEDLTAKKSKPSRK